jgi:hypothetical protein
VDKPALLIAAARVADRSRRGGRAEVCRFPAECSPCPAGPAGAPRAVDELLYSNLIEGRNTHPIDIERALRNDYSQDETKRDLQLEAKAHIMVQEWIDGGALRTRASVSADAICGDSPPILRDAPLVRSADSTSRLYRTNTLLFGSLGLTEV